MPIDIDDMKLYTRIAQTINHSFGTTGPGSQRVSTQKVSLSPVSDTLVRAHYNSIVAFSSNKMFEEMKRMHRSEAMGMLEAALKRAEEKYKELFPDEKAIKLELLEDSVQDSLEFTYFIQGTPVKRGFYKVNCLVNVK